MPEYWLKKIHQDVDCLVPMIIFFGIALYVRLGEVIRLLKKIAGEEEDGD